MDFFIAKKKDFIEKKDRVCQVFAKRNQEKVRELDVDVYTIQLYETEHARACFKQFENGDFIIVTGTFFYNGKYGNKGLNDLYDDFCGNNQEILSNIIGNYCIIICHKNRINIFNDYLGLLRVYHTEDFSTISSSFLAVSRMLDEKEFSNQEIYEYIIRGGMYGDSTVLKRIKLLKTATIFSLSDKINKRTLKYHYSRPNFYNDFDKMVDLISDKLVDYFNIIKSEFKSNITSALSGGYDSRLMLCCLRALDVIPNLYVYGGDNSSDVLVAKEIAESENLELTHINKNNYPKLSEAELEQIVESNFYYFDGLCIQGVFDNGSDLDTRLKRTGKGQLQINGGGGEIFRNYWHLNAKPKEILTFTRHKYDIFKYDAFTGFDKQAYFTNFSNKIKQSINGGDILSRKDIERAYPLFRLKYWQAINNSINSRFSPTLTPLIDPMFLFLSYDIPMKFKFNGKFQAAIINKIDSKLAKYNSNYGYAFNTSVPLKTKLENNIMRNIPIAIKPFLRNLSNKRKKFNPPYYLDENFLNTIVNSDSNITDYVKINELTDLGQLSRALTLKYFMQNEC